jgi:hypothetical protein
MDISMDPSMAVYTVPPSLRAPIAPSIVSSKSAITLHQQAVLLTKRYIELLSLAPAAPALPFYLDDIFVKLKYCLDNMDALVEVGVWVELFFRVVWEGGYGAARLIWGWLVPRHCSGAMMVHPRYGGTPFHYCLPETPVDVMEQWLMDGVSLNCRDAMGITALMRVCGKTYLLPLVGRKHYYFPGIFKVMRSMKDPSTTATMGTTTMAMADTTPGGRHVVRLRRCLTGLPQEADDNVAMVEWMLEHGASVDAVYTERCIFGWTVDHMDEYIQWTALSLAIVYGHTMVASMLLRASGPSDAPFRVRINDVTTREPIFCDMTPALWAAVHGRDDVFALLTRRPIAETRQRLRHQGRVSDVLLYDTLYLFSGRLTAYHVGWLIQQRELWSPVLFSCCVFRLLGSWIHLLLEARPLLAKTRHIDGKDWVDSLAQVSAQTKITHRDQLHHTMTVLQMYGADLRHCVVTDDGSVKSVASTVGDRLWLVTKNDERVATLAQLCIPIVKKQL